MFAKMEKCALRVAISYLGVVRRKLIARERNQNKIFDTLEMKLNVLRKTISRISIMIFLKILPTLLT